MSHQPRKRFGQNFLTDESVVARIIQTIQSQNDQHLVEIGPGQGVLTDFLVSSCQQLDLIELDRDLAELLEKKYAGVTHVMTHQLDALKLDLVRLIKAEQSVDSDANKLRLIGNLPYNISTPLMFHLLDQSEFILDMHFMLQKEVADRLAATAGTKKYGRLSVITQYLCHVHHLFDVAPESFNPRPKVWSSFIQLVPHQQPLVEIESFDLFNSVVTLAFSQRRKTIRNTLSKLMTAEQISSVNIDPGRRAETLTLQEFSDLTRLVAHNDREHFS